MHTLCVGENMHTLRVGEDMHTLRVGEDMHTLCVEEDMHTLRVGETCIPSVWRKTCIPSVWGKTCICFPPHGGYTVHLIIFEMKGGIQISVRRKGNYQSGNFLCTLTLLKRMQELPYSGLFSWVQIFVKSWKRPSELNFMVFNFVARYYTFARG